MALTVIAFVITFVITFRPVGSAPLQRRAPKATRRKDLPMTSNKNIDAIIIEQGNGFPNVGDILWDNEGNVYRLIATDGRIHTGRASGNYIHGTLEAADDADDADAPFEARVEID